MATETSRSEHRAPQPTLTTALQYLRGVGPRRAETLARLGLYDVKDLLFFFPRDYEDHSDQREISNLEPDKLQTVRGMVVDVDGRSMGFGKTMVGVLIKEADQYLRGLWFNQPYRREQFRLGQHVLFSGTPKQKANRWEMSHPRVTWLEDETDRPPTEQVPIYPLTAGLKQYQMRRLVAQVVEQFAEEPTEAFPEKMLTEFSLLSINKALRWIHFPPDRPSLDAARYRFIFQELFELQLALAERRWQLRSQETAPPLPATAKIDARIRRLFPFDLTADQEKAIQDVADDMALPRPMNRLLQGDVGCGKTMVAVYAMLLAVAHGQQAALMAPTEILARQHTLTLERFLTASRVRWALLAGSSRGAERRQILEKLRAGELDIVIGTHAVIQHDVEFARLGLVIIDEQHKFGVRQRAELRKGDSTPHYLVMTATPIPRSLTMTLFGDLEVSSIREMPPGRKQVHTYLVEDDKQNAWWKFVAEKLRSGRQGYVITPLVQESEALDVADVESTFESLANGPLEAFRLGLVHGRMGADEKEAAMEAFRRGETQLLVATSVIEVGIDVPNAAIITILSAERFGLSQLHQLRGRVGRGKEAGYCGVFPSPKATDSEVDSMPPLPQSEAVPIEPEEKLSRGRERLEAFVSTHNGFELAELDFQMRGPGNMLGTQQHGLPPLRIADLLRDRPIAETARKEAQLLISKDPGLRHADHARLRRLVLYKYGMALQLGDVG